MEVERGNGRAWTIREYSKFGSHLAGHTRMNIRKAWRQNVEMVERGLGEHSTFVLILFRFKTQIDADIDESIYQVFIETCVLASVAGIMRISVNVVAAKRFNIAPRSTRSRTGRLTRIPVSSQKRTQSRFGSKFRLEGTSGNRFGLK